MDCRQDVLCELLGWMIENVDALLVLVIGFGLVIMVYLSGRIAGHREGFVDGIAHYIQLKAYDAADFPERCERDRFVLEAQARLANNLAPRIPADIR